MRLLALLNISSTDRTRISPANAYNDQRSQQSVRAKCRVMSARPTVHSSLIIPVLHRTAVGSDFFLGFPGENARDCAEDVEVQAGLWEGTCLCQRLSWVFYESVGGKHTLALAFVLCSRLSTMPELDEPACGAGAAASWLGFLETVEEDMMVVGLDLRFEGRDSRNKRRDR
jgi:hypothetical protein